MSLLTAVDEFKLVTCAADVSVSEVADRMRSRDVGMVLVVDEAGRPVGIVTDRDLSVRVLAEGRRFDDPVNSVMTAPVVTVAVSQSLTEAMARMNESRVRRIVIVDERGRAVAVLSFGDLYRLFADELHQLVGLAPNQRKVALRSEDRVEPRPASGEAA